MLPEMAVPNLSLESFTHSKTWFNGWWGISTHGPLSQKYIFLCCNTLDSSNPTLPTKGGIMAHEMLTNKQKADVPPHRKKKCYSCSCRFVLKEAAVNRDIVVRAFALSLYNSLKIALHWFSGVSFDVCCWHVCWRCAAAIGVVCLGLQSFLCNYLVCR